MQKLHWIGTEEFWKNNHATPETIKSTSSMLFIVFRGKSNLTTTGKRSFGPTKINMTFELFSPVPATQNDKGSIISKTKLWSTYAKCKPLWRDDAYVESGWRSDVFNWHLFCGTGTITALLTHIILQCIFRVFCSDRTEKHRNIQSNQNLWW